MALDPKMPSDGPSGEPGEELRQQAPEEQKPEWTKPNPPFSDFLIKRLGESLRKPPMEIPQDMRVDPQENFKIPDDMRVDVAEGQPPVTGTDADKATPWYNNVIKKLKDTFVDYETEGTVSRELREQEEYHLGARAHVLDNKTVYEAFTKASHDLLYSTARVLEGTINLMNDAIRGTQDLVVDVGKYAGQEKLAKDVAAMPEAFQGTGFRPEGGQLPKLRVKATGGVLDVINIDRAKDMGVLGNKPPEVFVKDGVRMTSKEVADATIKDPTTAYPSNTHMDATVDRNLFMDESGAVKIPTWEDIHGTFVKSEQTPWEKIQRAAGLSISYISDVAKKSGLPIEVVHKELMSAVEENRASIHPSTKGSAELSEEVKAGAINIPGQPEPFAQMRVKEPLAEDKVRVHTDPSAMIEGDKPVEHPAAKQLAKEVLGGTKTEAIKSAAVKVGDKVYEGNLHVDAYEEAIKQDPDLSKLTNQELEAKATEGFVTTRGNFVGRKEAQDMPRGEGIEMSGRELYSALAKALGPEAASQRLSAAGVHGITIRKEQIKRSAVRVEGEVFEGQLHADAMEKVPEGKDLSTLEEGYTTTRGRFVNREEGAQIAGLKKGKELQAFDLPDEWHTGEGPQGDLEGHVVFDQRLVESLNVDGKPVPPPPGRPPSKPPPKPAGGVVTDPTGNIRADVWKGIADVKDVRALVEQANVDNGGFPAARAGQIPIEHADAISKATGIPLHEVVNDLAHNFNNPGKIRATMQALHDTAFQWWAAAVKAVGGNDIDSLIAYKEQQLLHETVQEYTTAKLAEAGRSLAVPQEFYGAAQQRPLKAEPPKPKPKAEGAAEEKPTFNKNDGLKEFREKVKDKDSLEGFLKAKGESIDGLRAEAKRITELNPDTFAVSRAGRERIRAKQMIQSPWYQKFWRENLVSGLFSHARYFLAGEVRNQFNATVVPAFNAMLNTMQAAAGRQFLPGERTYLGEVGTRYFSDTVNVNLRVPFTNFSLGEFQSRFWTGHVEGLEMMWQQMKSGIRPPFPGEKMQKFIDEEGNPLPMDQWPRGGPMMNAVGAIHTYHGWIAAASEIKGRAYRAAVDSGFRPGTEAFNSKMAEAVRNPDPTALKAAAEKATNLSLTAPLGDTMKPLNTFFDRLPGGYLLWSFRHVPVNIVKGAVQMTPGLQILSKDLWADTVGLNGPAKQASAFGKWVVGEAVLATGVSMFNNDMLTGDGPADPKDQAEFQLSHMKRAFAFSKTGRWYSYDGWGIPSVIIGWTADMAQIGHAMQAWMSNPNVTEADKKAREQEFLEVKTTAAHAIGHMMDEAGLRTLIDFFHMVTGTENESGYAMDRGAKELATGIIPGSSFFGQLANMSDPWQRRIDDVIGAFQAKLPGYREKLPVRTDWLGLPMANPRQGFGSIVPNMERDRSAINLELQRLDIKPILVPHDLQTVPMTPDQRAELQVMFGTLAREYLDKVIDQPDWREKPDNVRSIVITSLLNAARIQASQTFLLDPRHDILRRSVEDKVQAAQEGKPKPDLYNRPEEFGFIPQ